MHCWGVGYWVHLSGTVTQGGIGRDDGSREEKRCHLEVR